MMYNGSIMEVEVEKVKEEFSRDTYWTRIRLHAGDKKTSVLVCASLEYLWNRQGTRHFTVEQLTQFMQYIGNQWQKKGDGVFASPVHYDVYAVTDEGRENGQQFLRTKVAA